MKCPECERKIGFLESLTILNPLKFKCIKCSNYITLSRSSIKIYLFMLVVIFIISFIGFYYLGVVKILTRSILVIIVPVIIIGVTVIHYFFWNSASGELKEPDRDDISGLSC